MTEEMKQEILRLIAGHLTLDVDTKSEYVGVLGDGDALYKDNHTVSLLLDGEVISVVYL